MVEFTSIPIIVVLCYIIGEIYKVIFRKKKEAKKDSAFRMLFYVLGMEGE